MALSQSAIALIIVSVVFPFLATAAVSLRLQARRIKSLSLSSDDGWIIIALIITIAGGVLYVVGAFNGALGVHTPAVAPQDAAKVGKMVYAMTFIYIFSVAPVKISIILFYKRIFVTRKFCIAANALLAFVASWTVAFFFATLFQAWPISYNWTGIGSTTNIHKMYEASAITNILADFLTLCLPIPMIKSLHLSMRKKSILSSVFGLGAFCIIASAVRLYYLVDVNPHAGYSGSSYRIAQTLSWSSIEPCSSIICACLPTFGPLFQGGRSPVSLVHSLRSYISHRSKFTMVTKEDGGRKDSTESDPSSYRRNLSTEEEKRDWRQERLSGARDTIPKGGGDGYSDLEAQRELASLPQVR